MDCSMGCFCVGDAAAGCLPGCDTCGAIEGQSDPGGRHTVADAHRDGDAHAAAGTDANGNPYSIPSTAARFDAGAASEPDLSQ